MDAKNSPLASSSASAGASCEVAKPKPCCVCKEEKARRDECMLFSKASDPTSDCRSFVEQYRSCMAGFGFKV